MLSSFLSVARGEEFFEGLVDGTTAQAPVEKEEGEDGEDEIGAPGCEGGGENPGVAEGEGNLRHPAGHSASLQGASSRWKLVKLTGVWADEIVNC